MVKILVQNILTLILLTLMADASANPKEISFIIQHSMTETDAGGVTRIVNFSEQLYRSGNTVWVERVLPASKPHNAAHNENRHKHLDLNTTARWIVMGKNGLSLRLVDLHDKVIVNVPAPEYGNVGFDGKWENTSHLMDPKKLNAMRPLDKLAPKGQRWYELKSADSQLSVLWDENLEIPREVESQKLNGSAHKSMKVTAISTIKSAPWSRLSGYEQKDYSDFLD